MYIEYLPEEKHPVRNVDVTEVLEIFQDAGYLFTDNNLIIDIDNMIQEKAKRLLERFRIKKQIVHDNNS
ncbi:hypothetical protein [uncultured Enterococcus sp.]|uniref:hypothetical protein n=1 Tax=uncultured Enterococcus sp. TaxID=167972 RepID=UPI002AA7660D|nr:hypothetical protein [uncultured Enterococcus sp.]